MRGVVRMSVANLAGPITALLVSPLLARALGPSGRGTYAALTMPILVLGIAGTLGTQDAASYFVAKRGLRPADAIRLLLLLLIPASVLAGAVGVALGHYLFRPPSTDYRAFLFLLGALPLQIVFNMLLGAVTGAGDVRGVNGAKVFPTVARAIVILVLVVTVPVTPYLAAMVLLWSPLLGVGWILYRQPLRLRRQSSTVGIARSEFIRFSLAAFPGVLATISTARLDQVIGLPLIGSRELGLYAVAVSIAELAMVVPVAARTALLGYRSYPGVARDQQQLSRVVVAVTAAACVVLGIGSWVLIPPIFGQEFQGAVVPCLILLVATVVYSASTSLSAILLSLGRAGSQSRKLVLGSVVGVGSLIALRRFGAEGASLATLLGYTTTALLCCAELARSHGLSARDSLRLQRRDVVWVRESLRPLHAERGHTRVSSVETTH